MKIARRGADEFDRFDALQAALALHGVRAEAQPSEFFYTCAWFSNLAQHGIEANAGLLLILVRDPNAGSALCLPLQQTTQGLTGLSNYYSSLFGPVVWGQPPPPDTAPWRTLAQHLRQRQPREPVLTLSPMDTESPSYRGLRAALRQAGYAVDHYRCFGNWYVRVAGQRFADYAPTLPSALRNSIARGQRRLTRQGDWNVRIQSQPDDALEAAIAAFVQVYQQSWKQAEPHPEFVPQLIRTAAAQGWLRLGTLTLQGRAIAAQLWLVKDGKASIYKLAYVEGFARYSAGSILTHHLMQHALDVDQVHEVDYLTGDDAYKRDWMRERRERRGIVAFDLRTTKGLWAAGWHFCGKLRKAPTP